MWKSFQGKSKSDRDLIVGSCSSDKTYLLTDELKQEKKERKVISVIKELEQFSGCNFRNSQIKSLFPKKHCFFEKKNSV